MREGFGPLALSWGFDSLALQTARRSKPPKAKISKLTPGNSQAKKQPARAIFSVPSAPYRGATVRNLPAPVFSLPGRVPWMYKMGIHLFMRVRRIATDFIISRPSAAIV